MQMQEIKDRVTKVLNNKGVLTRLKAELRTNVFLAINDQDIQQGGIGLSSKFDASHRQQLLNEPSGATVVELVREFLIWCNLQFTIQVFEPEMQLHHAAEDRCTLQQQLGLSHLVGDAPVLLQLLQQYSASVLQQTEHLPGTASSGSSPAAVNHDQQLVAEPVKARQAGVQQTTKDQTPSAAVLSKTPAVSHSPAAVMLPCKSASIVEELDLEEVLIDTTPHLEPEDEEYAAVFLAAQGPVDGLHQEREDNSSSTSSTPHQQMGRPVHWAQPGVASSTVGQQVTPDSAATGSPHAEAELSDSFGYLDRSPGALSLELHETPGNLHDLEATPATPATASSSHCHGLAAREDTQQQPAAAQTTTAPLGRVAALEPLAPLRANKLAPLAPVMRRPGLTAHPGTAGGVSVSSEGLKQELRRAGLLASPDGASTSQASNSSSPGVRDKAGDTNSNQMLDSFVEQRLVSPPVPAAAVDSQGDVELDSDADRDLRAVADKAAAEDATAAQDTGGAGAVYRANAADGDFSSDDDSSDDFGIEVQRQLFDAARRQLSQTNQKQQQWLPDQQQPQPEKQQQHSLGHDVDSNSEVEIPEDISLPLEGLDMDDDDVYSGRLETAAQHVAAPAFMTDTTIGSGLQQPLLCRTQAAAGGIGMAETGLSLSDRSGDIEHLSSAADLVLDDDDF